MTDEAPKYDADTKAYAMELLGKGFEVEQLSRDSGIPAKVLSEWAEEMNEADG